MRLPWEDTLVVRWDVDILQVYWNGELIGKIKKYKDHIFRFDKDDHYQLVISEHEAIPNMLRANEKVDEACGIAPGVSNSETS